jgi:predicted Zn-dependent protease
MKILILFILLLSFKVISVELNINPLLFKNDNEVTGYAYGLAATGNFDKSLILLNDIIVKNPNNILAYKLQADIFYQQNKLDKSKQSLQNILNLSSNNVEASELLAKIFYQEGNLKKTQTLLLNLENRGHNLNSNSYKNLAKIYEKQGKCDQALNYLGKSAGLRSGSSIQLEQAMMVKRCLGDNSLYIHGSIEVSDNSTVPNHSQNYQE